MKKMKKGFTIVELVIVIGVIAILSAVLIPTFANLSQKAKDAKALQEVADTYTQYLIDKGEKANAQGDVCIEYASGVYYTYNNGWVKGSTNTKASDENPDTYNGIKVYETTDSHAA